MRLCCYSGLRGITPHEADAVGALQAAQEALCQAPNWPEKAGPIDIAKLNIICCLTRWVEGIKPPRSLEMDPMVYNLVQ